MNELPIIHRADEMTVHMARYWLRRQVDLAGLIDLIDPWRTPLSVLRRIYPRGLRLYRASTGGAYGRSVERKVL